MRDPKKLFTKEGYLKYQMHLANIREGLFFLRNSGDDLRLDDDEIMIPLFKMEEIIESLINENYTIDDEEE